MRACRKLRSLADERKSKARGMIHARLAGVEREVVLIR
jgi:hypothetical protein